MIPVEYQWKFCHLFVILLLKDEKKSVINLPQIRKLSEPMIAVPGKVMKASRYLSSLKEKNPIPECLNSEQNSLFSSMEKKNKTPD